MHSQEYLSTISSTSSIIDPEILEKTSSQYDAVYFTPSTYECALYSAGSSIQLVDHIVNEQILNGFALIRPPGHHAMKSEACG